MTLERAQRVGPRWKLRSKPPSTAILEGSNAALVQWIIREQQAAGLGLSACRGADMQEDERRTSKVEKRAGRGSVSASSEKCVRHKKLHIRLVVSLCICSSRDGVATAMVQSKNARLLENSPKLFLQRFP